MLKYTNKITMTDRILSVVSHLSYRMFAKRYGIRLTIKEGNTVKYRPSSELKKDICDFEEEFQRYIFDGMYF